MDRHQPDVLATEKFRLVDAKPLVDHLPMIAIHLIGQPADVDLHLFFLVWLQPHTLWTFA